MKWPRRTTINIAPIGEAIHTENTGSNLTGSLFPKSRIQRNYLQGVSQWKSVTIAALLLLQEAGQINVNPQNIDTQKTASKRPDPSSPSRGIHMLNRTQMIIWSHVTRKPVFGVCDQLRHKTACSADETSYDLQISAIASRGIILSRQRTTKAQIRPRACAGWSAPLLFAHGINRFSHDVAHVVAKLCSCWDFTTQSTTKVMSYRSVTL